MKHVKLFEGWRDEYDDELEDRELYRELKHDDEESDPYLSDREKEEQYNMLSGDWVFGEKNEKDILIDATIKSPTMSPADKLETMMDDVEFTRKNSDSQRKMKKIRKWISSLSPEERAGISM
jgi:hypothetical protein